MWIRGQQFSKTIIWKIEDSRLASVFAINVLPKIGVREEGILTVATLILMSHRPLFRLKKEGRRQWVGFTKRETGAPTKRRQKLKKNSSGSANAAARAAYPHPHSAYYLRNINLRVYQTGTRCMQVCTLGESSAALFFLLIKNNI